MAPDQGKIAQLASGPGIDTRTWVAKARIDDDPDAIRWAGSADEEDGPLGWIVDVTFVDGPLAGEGPVPCRLSTVFAGNGTLRSSPPGRGCLVSVLLTEGNPNTDPMIVGMLSANDCPVPETVNGTTIDEAYALGAHILVTDKAVDEQVAGDRRVQTGSGSVHRLLGESVELAAEDATQAFVRGNDNEQAINAALQAMLEFVTLVGGLTPDPSGGVPMTGWIA